MKEAAIYACEVCEDRCGGGGGVVMRETPVKVWVGLLWESYTSAVLCNGVALYHKLIGLLHLCFCESQPTLLVLPQLYQRVKLSGF